MMFYNTQDKSKNTDKVTVDSICKLLEQSGQELGLSIAGLRDPNIENRLEQRSTAYQLITNQFVNECAKKDSSEKSANEIKKLVEFFQPIFVGCDLPRVAFRTADGQSFDFAKYDDLVKILRDNFSRFTHFLDVLEAVFQEKFPLPEVLFEVIDPLHRPGTYLWKEYGNWKCTSGVGFFTRLAVIQSNSPRADHRVVYLCTEEQREPHAAQFTADGRIQLSGVNVDTTKATGKEQGRYAFALLPSGRFLLHEHTSGLFQHSSFAGGGSALCTGMVAIKKGKIAYIRNHSGHYRPTEANYLNVLKTLPANVFGLYAQIDIEVNRAPEIQDMFMKSSFKFFQKVGHGLRDNTAKKSFYVGTKNSHKKLIAQYHQALDLRSGALENKGVLPSECPSPVVQDIPVIPQRPGPERLPMVAASFWEDDAPSVESLQLTQAEIRMINGDNVNPVPVEDDLKLSYEEIRWIHGN